MKKLQTLLAAAMCGAIISAAISASAQTAGYGTVVRAVGTVSYSLGDNTWHPLLAGKHLPVGAIIRTGHNGVADIILGKSVEMPTTSIQPDRISYAPDSPVRGMVSYKPSVEQNVVRVTPNTTLGIDKLTVTDTGADSVSNTELNLKEGKIFASVKKMTGASDYLIKLPHGIAGVRGTLFSISADGTVAVFESKGGGVVLSLLQSNGETKTFVVTPGQLLDPVTGQPSPMPANLLKMLEDAFTSLQTVYLQLVDFSFDHTRVYVSPTQGGSQ